MNSRKSSIRQTEIDKAVSILNNIVESIENKKGLELCNFQYDGVDISNSRVNGANTMTISLNMTLKYKELQSSQL